MKLACAVAATLWMGCGIDTAAPGAGGPADPGGGDPGTADPGTGTVDPNDPGPGTGPVTQVSGHITASTAWSGSVHVVGNVIIDAGVVVTVMPGTTVDVEGNNQYGITVSGTLAIQGRKDAKVTFRSAVAGQYWADVTVPDGGVLDAHYLVQTGGGLTIVRSGKATIVDSHFSHVGGDLLTMRGGTLDMTYSEIGLATGRDTSHCDVHVGTSPIIRLSHSNLSAASFGIMFYGGNNADFTYDNWFGNSLDVATVTAPPVTGDFSHSYFAKGAPSHAGFTMTDMATAMVADAGVR
jgi:hypothetical protein